MRVCYNKGMLEIYFTRVPVRSEDYTRHILQKYYAIPAADIRKTIHGKPFLPGDKVCFNLSHSKGLTALAVGRRGAVGFDCEDLTGKARPAVLAKFSARERGEISSTRDFYCHWTARESYVKYLAGSLAALWRHVEWYGGRIYLDGKEEPVRVTQFEREGCSFSFCGDYARYTLRRADPPAR